MKYVCLYFSYIYFVFHITGMVADAHDTAPQKLADHFRRVLTDLKENKWTHYLADKLGDLSKMIQMRFNRNIAVSTLIMNLCDLDQGSCTDQ